MRMKQIKKWIGVFCAMAFILITQTVKVSASNDNHPFSFTMLGEYENSYSIERYRQTSSCSNPWKVIFTYSEEGKGTKANFWLARESDKKKSSGVYTVVQSNIATYGEALVYANETDVCLGCENNNYSTKSYSIAGYWDEETW